VSAPRGNRPAIRFVPLSTDPARIRFFGTFFPNLLLLLRSPPGFAAHLVRLRTTPREATDAYAASVADDCARSGNTLIFIHRWRTPSFDPGAFARASEFLARLRRMLERSGHAAEPIDALSPEVNLPRLAAAAGLGNLSPFGLLVHPRFGPRVIINALRTDWPWVPLGRGDGHGAGCTDCMRCLEQCPQDPRRTGAVELARCQRCTLCISACPVGQIGLPR
jgi:epoxyqueuosine reductase